MKQIMATEMISLQALCLVSLGEPPPDKTGGRVFNKGTYPDCGTPTV
jgi:hypothetical protein